MSLKKILKSERFTAKKDKNNNDGLLKVADEWFYSLNKEYQAFVDELVFLMNADLRVTFLKVEDLKHFLNQSYKGAKERLKELRLNTYIQVEELFNKDKTKTWTVIFNPDIMYYPVNFKNEDKVKIKQMWNGEIPIPEAPEARVTFKIKQKTKEEKLEAKTSEQLSFNVLETLTPEEAVLVFDETFKKRHIKSEEETIQELKEREGEDQRVKEEGKSFVYCLYSDELVDRLLNKSKELLIYDEDDNDLFYYGDSRELFMDSRY
jgi:hypothetical protein